MIRGRSAAARQGCRNYPGRHDSPRLADGMMEQLPLGTSHRMSRGHQLCLARMCKRGAVRLRKPRVSGDVSRLVFLPGDKGDLLLGGTTAGELHLWDMGHRTERARSCVSSWAAHAGGSGVTALCVSGASSPGSSIDVQRVITGSDDYSLRSWDIHRSGCSSLVREFDTHSGDITSVDVSEDSGWMVSASADTTVCLWDVGLRRPVIELEMESPVQSACFLNDPHLLLVAQQPSMSVIDLRMYRQSGDQQAVASLHTKAAMQGGPLQPGVRVGTKRISPAARLRTFSSHFQGLASKAPMRFDERQQTYQRVFAGHDGGVERLTRVVAFHNGMYALSASQQCLKTWCAADGRSQCLPRAALARPCFRTSLVSLHRVLLWLHMHALCLGGIPRRSRTPGIPGPTPGACHVRRR